jgi:UDP-glucose 4-epimerase
VLRLANGFGAPAAGTNTRWDIIVNEMCRAAVTDGRITIRSSGLAWRNFVPMQDVVGAIAHTLDSAGAGTYNLGASHSMTLRQMATRIADVCETVLHVRPTIETGPKAPDERHEPLDFRIAKLAAAGFTPTASLDEEVAALLVAASHTERAGDRG